MKIKIYRSTNKDDFGEFLRDYDSNPDVAQFDIDDLEDPTVNHFDMDDEESEYYYLHGTIAYDNTHLIERIGYWRYVFIEFEDGSYLCSNELSSKEACDAFAEKLIGCLKAGSAGNTEEYVDLDSIIF